MGKLLTSFDQPAKKPFQLYTIEHGIERLTVKVPLKEAAVFEQRFNQSDKSKNTITELLKSLGGSMIGSR